MSNAGRPRALNETKCREVCAIVTAGASLKQAAKYVGCSVSTINREAKREESFREQLRRASVAAQLAPLQSLRAAANSHWRAAAWMLERIDPEKFGQRRVNHFGSKELRALRRDLLAIVRDEIDHPGIRERMEKRFRATLDYAMRHAWDSTRSGGKLNQAMKYFKKKDAAANPNADQAAWSEFDELMADVDAMLCGAGKHDANIARDEEDIVSNDANYAPKTRSPDAKPPEYCAEPDQEAAGFVESPSKTSTQN